jgi:hypothetical protein
MISGYRIKLFDYFTHVASHTTVIHISPEKGSAPMPFKEYVLFRDGWDEESEKETEDRLVLAAASPAWQHQFLPAFVETLKREQFIKIMECLDRDKNLDFNRGFVAGIDLVLNRLDRIFIMARTRND